MLDACRAAWVVDGSFVFGFCLMFFGGWFWFVSVVVGTIGCFFRMVCLWLIVLLLFMFRVACGYALVVALCC